MREAGEPGEVDDRVPVVGGDAASEVGVAADDDGDAGNELCVG